MENLFFYFGKVVLCSAVMFLYYRIFLKDKTFHHYNRFYLLGTLFVSLFLPLLKVDYFTINLDQNIYGLLALFQNTPATKIPTNYFTFSTIIFSAFAVFSFIFILKFVFAVLKINKIKKEYPRENFEGISFYMTNLENAPFSFFKNLFWRKSILLQSDLGKQILKHEMVHIEQKHSYDKVLIEIVTAIFWFNPFFYLIRKEINLIHEYLADKKALKNSDTKAFAQMLLETHFSGSVLPATSPFLNSNLKKRITMLKKSNTKFSYWRKVFALPLLFILVFAYMVKAENREINKTNKMVTEMTNFYNQKSKNDTINPTKNNEYSFIKNNVEVNLISEKLDSVHPNSSSKLEVNKFPNPMTINLYRSSDDNTFVISGNEVSKKEFIDYFVKYNTNKDYSFGSTQSTFNELETAGKLAIFTAGKSNEIEKDAENFFTIIKKYQKTKPSFKDEIGFKTLNSIPMENAAVLFNTQLDFLNKLGLNIIDKASYTKDDKIISYTFDEKTEKRKVELYNKILKLSKDENYLKTEKGQIEGKKLLKELKTFEDEVSARISESKGDNKFLEFFNTAQKDLEKFQKGIKDRKMQLQKEITDKTSRITSKNNFYKGRDYDKEPLTNIEKENLKIQSKIIENIRKKYTSNTEKNNNTFIGFKPGKSAEVVYDISGIKKKETEISNDRLLVFPNFLQNSEYYLDGKKVSKETILKLSENLFATEDFFKKPPTIKTMKREMVTNGKENYLMKLELFTK